MASLRIKAYPVPPSEGLAFEQYSGLGLARVAQYNGQHSLIRADEVPGLLRFLKEFPTSIYAETLRDGAVGLLQRELRGSRIPAKGRAFVDEYLASARSAVE